MSFVPLAFIPALDPVPLYPFELSAPLVCPFVELVREARDVERRRALVLLPLVLCVGDALADAC
jgi:hypothetical protein